MSFTDTILLPLKREYSKDECVKLVYEELSNAKFKIGELQSENAELKDKLKESAKLRSPKYESSKLSAPLIWIKPKLTKEDMKDERFLEQNKRLSTQGQTIKKLNDELNRWRSKYFDLAAKSDKVERSVATEVTTE